MYKREAVKGSYSGGYSLSRRGGGTDTQDDGSCPGGTYTVDCSYKGYGACLYKVWGGVYRGVYGQDIKRKEGKRNDKKGGGYKAGCKKEIGRKNGAYAKCDGTKKTV